MITNEDISYNNKTFKFMCESISDLIVLLAVEKDYTIEWVNDEPLKRDLGFQSKDFTGNSFLSYLHSDDIKKTMKFFAREKSSSKILRNIRIQSKKAKFLWYDMKKKNFINDLNQKKIFCILKNITEKKQFEIQINKEARTLDKITKTIPEIKFWRILNPKTHDEAIRNSYEMLNNIMENIPQFIFWKDNNLRYLGCNQNFKKFMGLDSIDNILDKTDEELFGNNDRIGNFNLKETLILKNNHIDLHSIESWFIDNNTTLWLDVNRIPLHDSKGKVIGILVTFEDITFKHLADRKIKESEKKYRDMTELLPDAVYEANKKGNLTYLNPIGLEKLGYKYEDIEKGLNIKQLLFEKDKERAANNIARILNGEILNPSEYTALKKDGSHLYVRIHSRPLYKNDNIVGLRGIISDITEKKVYEKLIEELNLNFLNYTTNIQNNIQLLLNTFCKLMKAEIALFSFKSFEEGKDTYYIISNEDDLAEINSDNFENFYLIYDFYKNNQELPRIFLNLDSKGLECKDPYISRYNLKGAYGKLIGEAEEFNAVLCVFYKNEPQIHYQDQMVLYLISDAIKIEHSRWRAQYHLEQQNIRLNEINKLKTDLITRTSHELKTPLIAIKGFSDLLLKVHKSKFDDEVFEIIEDIKKGSNRLEKLINSLLKSLQLEQNKSFLKLENVYINQIIKDCILEQRSLIVLRKLQVIMELQEDLKINLDKEQMKVVVVNILNNAIKFTQSGGKIIIRTKEEENNVIISFIDNGIGLTDDEKQKLFTQFGKIERYGMGWDVETEGTGLGLFISKKIVELHGGKIWAESDGRNKGSSFHISVPLSSTKIND